MRVNNFSIIRSLANYLFRSFSNLKKLVYFDKESGMRCGPGWVGVVFLSIAISALIILLSILQKIFIKK